jgi:hypothetical protein
LERLNTFFFCVFTNLIAKNKNNMTAGSNCCCLHVKTCATVVAIIGIISSVLQILSVFLLWWYVPMNIILLITYIFVLIGVSKERPGFLLPAEIILGINFALSVLVFIGFIIVGAVLPDGIVDDYTDGRTLNEAKDVVRFAFFLSAFFIFLASSYTIFSFFVIHRARKWLSENERTSYQAPTYPIVYGSAPPSMQPPVYHASQPSPQSYGAPGYQQSYNLGSYPQQYNPSPQPSPQPGYQPSPQLGYNNDGFNKF